MKQIPSFTKRVLETVRHIPKGSVSTYQEVAKHAGSPGAARAVGSIMRKNTDETVPCHRVIKSNGKLGSYNRGGEAKKRALLIHEGAINE